MKEQCYDSARYLNILHWEPNNEGCNVTLTFESVDEILKCDHSIVSYWAVLPCVLFIMLNKVVLTFGSVDEILSATMDSNESHWAALSCSAAYYAAQCGSNFWVCGWNPEVWPFKWKLLSSTLLWCCLLCCTSWFLLLSLWSGNPKV